MLQNGYLGVEADGLCELPDGEHALQTVPHKCLRVVGSKLLLLRHLASEQLLRDADK